MKSTNRYHECVKIIHLTHLAVNQPRRSTECCTLVSHICTAHFKHQFSRTCSVLETALHSSMLEQSCQQVYNRRPTSRQASSLEHKNAQISVKSYRSVYLLKAEETNLPLFWHHPCFHSPYFELFLPRLAKNQMECLKLA